MKTKHTQVPWNQNEENTLIIEGCDHRLSICEVHDHSDTSDVHNAQEAEANAEFIVRAVNNHDVLVGAIDELFKQCVMMHKYYGEIDNTREADNAINTAKALLAKAKGE